MQAISLFSGVGGFELGFDRCGIETVLQAERDRWCLEVLQRHWPGTERAHDVRDVRGEPGSIDLLYGGFPCQDLSVAGRRAGLGGSRSNLWFEFRRCVSELRPRWVVVENVAGLHSSSGGEDFTIVASGLARLGYGVAWRILDGQFFRTAQRRRRVFIVGTRATDRRAGAERAAEVLSLRPCCGGGPAPKRPPRKDVATTLGGGTSSGGPKPDTDRMNFVAVPIQDAREVAKAQNGLGIGQPGDAMFTLDGASRHAVAIPDVAWALQEQDAKGPDSSTKAGHLLPVYGVRRLTPRECERLMGWPDDWTRWTADGREIADSHRYRMCGNGVQSPVAEWIGHRLVAVDRLGHEPVE